MNFEKNVLLKLIIVIANKCDIPNIIELTKKAGAEGTTVMDSKNSKTNFFNIPIEPEKELIIVLAKEEKIESILYYLNNDSNINTTEKIKAFTLDLNKVNENRKFA